MKKDQTVDKFRRAILDVIFEKFDRDECVVFLFGTQAEGAAVSGSDIDIGILCNYKIKITDFIEIHDRLNNDVPTLRKIDFVDFATVSDVVKKEALKEIKIWHTGRNCPALLKSLRQA